MGNTDKLTKPSPPTASSSLAPLTTLIPWRADAGLPPAHVPARLLLDIIDMIRPDPCALTSREEREGREGREGRWVMPPDFSTVGISVHPPQLD